MEFNANGSEDGASSTAAHQSSDSITAGGQAATLTRSTYLLRCCDEPELTMDPVLPDGTYLVRCTSCDSPFHRLGLMSAEDLAPLMDDPDDLKGLSP